jgi:hypothetical protein
MIAAGARNMEIVEQLFLERASCTLLENEDDLWQLAEKIEAPSTLFRIAQVFSFVLYYLPQFCSRWYIQEVKSIILQHRVRFFASIEALVESHPQRKTSTKEKCPQALSQTDNFDITTLSSDAKNCYGRGGACTCTWGSQSANSRKSSRAFAAPG